MTIFIEQDAPCTGGALINTQHQWLENKNKIVINWIIIVMVVIE
ncbi:MAG: hypothetical protein OQL28_06525 [Sedimenticola sp.]|nr:hypothetical protein [Sedimenticola sp.]